MSTGHTFHARNGARDRAWGVFFWSRVVVVVVSSVVCLGLLLNSQTAAGTVVEINTPGTRVWFLCSVRDLPWADPPLPGTKRPKWRAGDHRRVGQFGGLGLLWNTPGRGSNQQLASGCQWRRVEGEETHEQITCVSARSGSPLWPIAREHRARRSGMRRCWKTLKPSPPREITFCEGCHSTPTYSHPWGQPELAVGGRRRCPRQGGAMSTRRGTWHGAPRVAHKKHRGLARKEKNPARKINHPAKGPAPPGSILFSVPVGVHATKKRGETKKNKKRNKGPATLQQCANYDLT